MVVPPPRRPPDRQGREEDLILAAGLLLPEWLVQVPPAMRCLPLAIGLKMLPRGSALLARGRLLPPERAAGTHDPRYQDVCFSLDLTGLVRARLRRQCAVPRKTQTVGMRQVKPQLQGRTTRPRKNGQFAAGTGCSSTLRTGGTQGNNGQAELDMPAEVDTAGQPCSK